MNQENTMYFLLYLMGSALVHAENLGPSCINFSGDDADFREKLSLVPHECVNLKPNESQVIESMPSRSNYLLTRLADVNRKRVFRADIRFLSADLNQQNELNKIARDCLKLSVGKLIGSKGESLAIFVNDDQFINQKISNPRDVETTIRLSSETKRSEAGNWHLPQDCQVITHEILHHFGLIDEYPETDTHGSEKVWVTNSGGKNFTG